MAINEITVNLENKDTINKVEGGKMEERKTIFIPTAVFREDSIEKELALEYKTKRPFATIFGRIRSLKPVINLLEYKNFNPIYLTKEMTPREFKEWKRRRVKRVVPNNTEIFKLVVADRLFSDRPLLQAFKERYGDKLDDVLIVPFIKIKRGIIETEAPNKNLRVYGLVMTRVMRMILKGFGDVNILEMDREEFHNKKLEIKEQIWKDMEEYLRERPVLKGLMDEIDDEKLKEIFMK